LSLAAGLQQGRSSFDQDSLERVRLEARYELSLGDFVAFVNWNVNNHGINGCKDFRTIDWLNDAVGADHHF
jgi:hypothetical protein